MRTIEIYGRKITGPDGSPKDCSWCSRARALASMRGYAVAYHDITDDAHRTEELGRRAPDAQTVPQIFVGDHHVGGFTDLAAADRSGALQQLIAGS